MINMKKILLSLAFALMGFASAFAAKAHPGLTTINQSDGTQLTIRLNGDENAHWYETSDGVLLVQVGANYYIAQVEEDGSLKATPQLAHNVEERGTVEKRAIEKQDKEFFFATAKANWNVAQAKRIGISDIQIPYFPHGKVNGKNPKVLVILVNFSDVKFQSSDPQATFNHYLNAEAGEAAPAANNSYRQDASCQNFGSAKQYFSDISQGQFTPEFTVLRPVEVSKSATYYGRNSGSASDLYYIDLAKEACQLAKAQIDFADFDQNGDGYVDLVYFIYAGYGECFGDNDANLLWPKAVRSEFSVGDAKFYHFGLQCELNSTPKEKDESGRPMLTGVGLFLHEFTHTMGIPDVYPTVKSAQVDNQNPEYWDLMDSGEYTYNGYCPTPYSPWEMDVMGWAAPTELDKTPQQISLESYADNRKAYKIKGENDEYLLIQNIQKTGWWRYLFGNGLLVWRIDYPYTEVSTNRSLNNTVGKPNVMIVPADDYVISEYQAGTGLKWTTTEYRASLRGDIFPGTTGRTNLLEAKLNNSTMTNLLYNIKQNEDGTMGFDYLKDFTTGIDSPAIGNETEKDTRIFTLDGRYLGTDASHLNKGIYIIGKKKIVIK